MKKFEDLHIDDQNRLLIDVLRLLADSGCRTIEEVAADRGVNVDELWRDVCADTGPSKH